MSEAPTSENIGAAPKAQPAVFDAAELARIMEERRRDPTKRAMQRPDDFASRTFGFIMLGLGLYALVSNVYWPLKGVLQHEGQITYSEKYIVLAPLLLAWGFIYSLWGERASSFLGPTTRPGRWGLLVMLVCVVAGLCGLFVFKQYLSVHGYAYVRSTWLGL